jgi:type III restriction enzyme
LNADELKKLCNSLKKYVNDNVNVDDISSKYKDLFDIQEFRQYQKEAISVFEVIQTKRKLNELRKIFNIFEINLSDRHFAFQMATGSGKTLLMAVNMIQLFEKKGINKFIITAPKGIIYKKTERNFLKEASEEYLFDKKQKKYDFVPIKNIKDFDKIEKQTSFAKGKTIYIYANTIQKLNSDSKNTKENSWTWEQLKDKQICLLGDEAHHYSGETRGGGNEDTIESYEETIDKFLDINDKNIVVEYSATYGFNEDNMREKYHDKLIFDYNIEKFYQAGYCKRPMTLLTTSWRQSLTDKPFLKKYIIYSILVNEFKGYLLEKKLGKKVKPFVLAKFRKIEQSGTLMEAIEELYDELSAGEPPAELEEVKREIENKEDSILINHMKDENFMEQDLKSMILEFFGVKLSKKKKTGMKFSRVMRYDGGFKNKEKEILLKTIDNYDNALKLLIAVEMVSEGWDVDNLFTMAIFEDRYREGISIRQLLGRGLRLNKNIFDSELRVNDAAINDPLSQLENLHILCNMQNVLVQISKNIKEELGEKNTDKKDDKIELELKDEYIDKKIYYEELEKTRVKERISIDELEEFIVNATDKAVRYKNIRLANIKDEKLQFQLLRPILYKLEEQDFWEYEETEKGEIELNSSITNEYQSDIWEEAISEYFATEMNPQFLMYIDYSTTSELIDLFKDLQIKVSYYADDDILEDGQLTEIDTKALFFMIIDYLVNLIEKKKIYNQDKKIYEEELGEVFRTISKTNDDNYHKIHEESFHVYKGDGFFGNNLERVMGEVLNGFCKENENSYWIRNELQYTVYLDNNYEVFKPDFLLFVKDDQAYRQILIETKGEHIKLFHTNPDKEEFLSNLNKPLGEMQEYSGDSITALKGFYYIPDEIPDKEVIKTKLMEVLND